MLICPRCLLPIGPDQDWQLDHDDVDLVRAPRAPLLQQGRPEPTEVLARVVTPLQLERENRGAREPRGDSPGKPLIAEALTGEGSPHSSEEW